MLTTFNFQRIYFEHLPEDCGELFEMNDSKFLESLKNVVNEGKGFPFSLNSTCNSKAVKRWPSLSRKSATFCLSMTFGICSLVKAFLF